MEHALTSDWAWTRRTLLKTSLAGALALGGRLRIDRGTIRRRQLPVYTVVKTGTLRHVATLAGVILTRAHGPVWFALLSRGSNLWGFRTQQDALLQYLIAHWGAADPPPASFIPTGPVADTIRNDTVMRTKTGGG